jgi:hypothetical protein
MAEPKKDERTSSLLRRLINTSDLEKFIECNASEMGVPAFHVYITDLCKLRGKIPEQVIRQAAIERSYGRH